MNEPSSSSVPQPHTPEPTNDEIDLIEVAKKIWSYRLLIIIITGVFMVGSVVYALVASESYQASVKFYKSEGEGAVPSGGLMSLASQFGMGGMATSSMNIKDLLTSNNIADRVIFKDWQTEAFEEPVNFITFWELEWEPEEDPDSTQLIFSAREAYKETVSIDHDEESGLITISVMLPEPQLAADVANFIAKEIDTYVRKDKKTQVKENINYITTRLDTVKRELRQAENALKRFEENNRRIESPELSLQYMRMQRSVTIKEQTYLTLQSELEKAKVQLVKETPIINILDAAEKPAKRAKPNKKLIVIIGTFLGGFLGLFAAIGLEVWAYLKKAWVEHETEV